jgi:orotidine-5'-phosphate decarboxylase
MHFADDLIRRVRELRHPLCVGLDPHLDRLPPLFRQGSMAPNDPATADAVEAFCCAVVDRLEGRVAVVKPQIAFFEQLGWRGLRALERVVQRCRERNLLVLLDAKRGDIGSTAGGYARSYLSDDAPLHVDALTLNAYLGMETLEPFAATGAGMFVLVRTSNPGAGDLQDIETTDGPIFVRMARNLRPLSDRLTGLSGWSNLGVVVGATWPEQAQAVRAELPNALFLVPGFGAQGGSAAGAVSGFVKGPAGLEGGIVSSSRGILFPTGSDTADAGAWEQAIDAGLQTSIDALSEAVSA